MKVTSSFWFWLLQATRVRFRLVLALFSSTQAGSGKQLLCPTTGWSARLQQMMNLWHQILLLLLLLLLLLPLRLLPTSIPIKSTTAPNIAIPEHILAMGPSLTN